MQDQYAHCAALVREADRDRYLAALLAPAERRNALFALYAFDVEISRIRDIAREPMPGEIRLQWWREVLLGERTGEAAAHPVAAALLRSLSAYGLKTAALVELIETHRFDIYDEPMGRFASLQAYAARTQGVVFEYGAEILGGPVNTAACADAGQARTIGNILLQFPRHAARRQIYVPLDMLNHYGANPDDIFTGKTTAEIRAALADLRLRARRHLTRLGTNWDKIPERTRPVFLPLAPLRAVLLKMEKVNYDPFDPPAVASWRRQWQMWRATHNASRIFS